MGLGIWLSFIKCLWRNHEDQEGARHFSTHLYSQGWGVDGRRVAPPWAWDQPA